MAGWRLILGIVLTGQLNLVRAATAENCPEFVAGQGTPHASKYELASSSLEEHLHLSQKVRQKAREFDAFVANRPTKTGISVMGITRRVDHAVYVEDLVLPHPDRILDLQTLDLQIDMGELSDFYNSSELVDLSRLKAALSSSLGLNWEMVISDKSIYLTDRYLRRVGAAAKARGYEPNFSLRYPPSLGRSHPVSDEGPVNDITNGSNDPLHPSVADLQMMEVLNVSWMEIRIVGSAENLTRNDVVTSRFYNTREIQAAKTSIAYLAEEIYASANLMEEHFLREPILQRCQWMEVNNIEPAIVIEYALGETRFNEMKSELGQTYRAYSSRDRFLAEWLNLQ